MSSKGPCGLVGVTLVCLSMASCSGTTQSSTAGAPAVTASGSAVGTSDVADPLDGLTLPLDSFVSGTADSQTLLRKAVDVLNAECMAEKGFEFLGYPPRPFRSNLNPRARYGYL